MASSRAVEICRYTFPRKVYRFLGDVDHVRFTPYQDTIVVNLDISSPEGAPDSPQGDPFHSAPGKR
jgi:hypothetical protein